MAGWFDESRAEQFRAPNSPGCSPADAAQVLHRTSLGRWVLEDAAGGRESRYRFLAPNLARDWLRRHGMADAAARFFGPARTPAAQSRRPRAGRPEVGGPVVVRLGADLLADVDNYAGARNVSRASAIRTLISAALAGAGGSGDLECDGEPGRGGHL